MSTQRKADLVQTQKAIEQLAEVLVRDFEDGVPPNTEQGQIKKTSSEVATQKDAASQHSKSLKQRVRNAISALID